MIKVIFQIWKRNRMKLMFSLILFITSSSGVITEKSFRRQISLLREVEHDNDRFTLCNLYSIQDLHYSQLFYLKHNELESLLNDTIFMIPRGEINDKLKENGIK